jgi:hypothetical protein
LSTRATFHKKNLHTVDFKVLINIHNSSSHKAGFIKAGHTVVYKRKQLKKNVLLLYHISYWVTGPTRIETPVFVEESSTKIN